MFDYVPWVKFTLEQTTQAQRGSRGIDYIIYRLFIDYL